VLAILLVLTMSRVSVSQTVFYIDAASGNDSNAGTLQQPFKTIAKGLSALGSNVGTLYLRAGTYASSSKISLTKSGSAGHYIKIWAYPGEKVVVDCSGNANTSDDGFSISGNYYHLKGLDIRFAPHNGIKISGNSNIVESCITRNCGNTGLHITGGSSETATTPSNNLILNCDSFYNFDSPTGGNADGFSAKWAVGPGNIFRGCRAWNNSDDGWDLWMCTASVLIDSCYAFRNGVDIWHTGQVDGNGNGFKLGGNGVATPHTIRNCVAFDNEGNGGKGFDENNNLAGQTLYNCTAFRNQRYNYAFNNDPLTTGTHIIKNCISYLPGMADAIRNAVQENNSWQGFSVTESDFLSTDTAAFLAPRDANGKLPYRSFLRLKAGSSLIDAGVDVGIPFTGSAPDLGAFEYADAMGISLWRNEPILRAHASPNPFGTETTITYELQRPSEVIIVIYSAQGIVLASTRYPEKGSGEHQIALHAESWERGMYFFTIHSGTSKFTGKIIKL
jgi:hypothetical protein